jgi:hypothetical protein
MLRIAGVLLIYLLVAAPLAHAQTLEERYGTIIVDDDTARDAIRLALQKIDKSMCGPQEHCAPATPEELTQPPITALRTLRIIAESRSVGCGGVTQRVGILGQVEPA